MSKFLYFGFLNVHVLLLPLTILAAVLLPAHSLPDNERVVVRVGGQEVLGVGRPLPDEVLQERGQQLQAVTALHDLRSRGARTGEAWVHERVKGERHARMRGY